MINNPTEKYFNNKSLLARITKDFQIDYEGDHGLSHWKRVYRNTQVSISIALNIKNKADKV